VAATLPISVMPYRVALQHGMEKKESYASLTIYYISTVVTHHVKSAALLQLFTFGYMFRPLPGHNQANKE